MEDNEQPDVTEDWKYKIATDIYMYAHKQRECRGYNRMLREAKELIEKETPKELILPPGSANTLGIKIDDDGSIKIVD